MINAKKGNAAYLLLLVAVTVLYSGCGRPVKPAVSPLAESVDLDTTIGNLADFYQYQAVPVIGFGIVAGLYGTGSSECPPALRDMLVKYIWQQLPADLKMNPDVFISSKDTAVVEVYGVIPSLAFKGQTFDLKIRALPGTQTASLEGGRLYTTDLKEMSRIQNYDQFAKTLATGQGSVYIDRLDGDDTTVKTQGHVLGGGSVSDNVKLALALRQPSYVAANTIRNRINERFGPKTAKAISPGEIIITIPDKFRPQKLKFIDIVLSMYLAGDEELVGRRITALVQELVGAENKLAPELALEAIGAQAVKELLPILNSGDTKASFHAARCILSIGDDRALPVLARLAGETGPFRIEAINAIGSSANRTDAVRILTRILSSDDFDARFAAYEQLRILNDISISHVLIAGDFMVDRVFCSGTKVIYVSRKDGPHIVLFGSPINCRDDVFVESPDKSIVINAPAGQKFLSIARKHPKKPRPFGPLKATFELTDIIKTLCEDPEVTGKSAGRPGLGVQYDQAIDFISLMCRKNALPADFRTGSMAESFPKTEEAPKSSESTTK